MHFVFAALIAKMMRGNIPASIMATFFGNPITFVPIAATSMEIGHFLLGTRHGDHGRLGDRFKGAWQDLWDNFLAIFTPERAHWGRLGDFFYDVFLPYLVGGMIPGVICAIICYYLSVPVITAYQNRRKGRVKAKWAELKAKKATSKAASLEDSPPAE